MQTYVPRLSYLPFLLERLHAFFSAFLIDPAIPPSVAWFSFETLPLKWHYPIGLLYDLFSGAGPVPSPPPKAAGKQPLGSGAAPLPWQLVMHYSGFPTDQLVRFDAEGKALHDAFINSVKEADFLRNGSAKAIMTLSKEDSTALWEAVRTSMSDQSLIFSALLSPPASIEATCLKRRTIPDQMQATSRPSAPSTPSSSRRSRPSATSRCASISPPLPLRNRPLQTHQPPQRPPTFRSHHRRTSGSCNLWSRHSCPAPRASRRR